MSVVDLTTFQFRNLVSNKIEFHKNLNFLLGDNGSGKSSFLESIFYLGHGKSFRTSNVGNLIVNAGDKFVISVLTDSDSRLGIEHCSNGNNVIKIDGETKGKLSELAKNIVVQIVTPESFRLFFGGPKERRKFVDMGLFHVEHSYSELWKRFNKTLKHRNACLKQKLIDKQFEYWTSQFCQLSVDIASLRHSYIEQLRIELGEWLQILLPDIKEEISVQYLQGWNSKKSLEEILLSNKFKELEKGYSLYGAQKFDIRFLLEGIAIENKLSRGQQKLFLLALTLAQTKLIEKVNRIKPILLVDDIGAELDENSRSAMSKALSKVNCQTFITAIDVQALEPLIPKNNNEYKMFHVEHGKISLKSE